jgi:hypothetical protein
MSLQIAQTAPVALAEQAAVPTNEAGTLLAQFSLPGDLGRKPSDYRGSVKLTNGTSVELVVFVKDANGWMIALETGNVGMIGGQALASGKSYAFEINGIGAYDAVMIVEQNNIAGVAVTATIQPIRTLAG